MEEVEINFLRSCKMFRWHLLDDLGNNVALSAHDGVPLTPWYLNGATVDLNNDILALRLHCHIGAANEDLDLLLGLR